MFEAFQPSEHENKNTTLENNFYLSRVLNFNQYTSWTFSSTWDIRRKYLIPGRKQHDTWTVNTLTVSATVVCRSNISYEYFHEHVPTLTLNNTIWWCHSIFENRESMNMAESQAIAGFS